MSTSAGLVGSEEIRSDHAALLLNHLVDNGFADPGFLDFLLTRDTVPDLMRSLVGRREERASTDRDTPID